MSKFARSLLALALASAFTVTLTSAASAVPSPAPDAAIAAALGRIATGNGSAADIALIGTRPELAEVVADPRRTKVTRTVTMPTGPRPGEVAAKGVEYCGGWVKVTVTVFTAVFNDVLFKWRHHAGFCIDYQVGVVTRWESRYDHILEADATVVLGQVTRDEASPMPRSPAVSLMQRHLQQCILTYGCWANWYPWAQIYVWGNGDWGYGGGPG